MDFQTRDDAHKKMMEYVDAGILDTDGKEYWPAGMHILRHGEYAKPLYKVRKRRGRDEYYIHASYFFYPGTFYAPENGPVNFEFFANMDLRISGF